MTETKAKSDGKTSIRNPIQASPPGEPDSNIDLSRIKGYVTADPIVMYNRQRLRKDYLALALTAWSFAVLLMLLVFIISGSVLFLAVGYVVTVPYLFVCYKFRDVSDYADELALYCRMDGC